MPLYLIIALTCIDIRGILRLKEESKDIYQGDPALISLENGMRFRIPENGETVIDYADAVLPEKKKT